MSEFEKRYYESAEFWEGAMLQDSNNLERFSLTSELIPSDVSSLLDVGCGNGVFIHHLHDVRPALYLHGLDRSEKALEFVRASKSLGDASLLPFKDNEFDCISCLEVLEHLPVDSYSKSLDELARVARKYLLISVPFEEKLEESHTQCPSCKSIFNYELHLRNFSEQQFKEMFLRQGFKNVKTVKAGKMEHFKYHDLYRRYFYPEQFLQWKSPICPLCGYVEEMAQEVKNSNGTVTRRKPISYISAIPKMIWPKEFRYYWIIGLFERS